MILIILAQCTKKTIAEKEIKQISLIPFALIKESKEIILSSPKSILHPSQIKIVKKDSIYIVQKGNGYYYAKQDLMMRFFACLSKNTSSYIISSNYSEYTNYSLDEKSAFNIRLVGEDREILIDLYIGSLDATGERQYIRRGALSSQILSIDDVASPFLTTENAFWVDMQPFKAKLKNNVLISVTRKEEIAVREKSLESSFANLEELFSSLTMIDVFDGLRAENTHTSSFTFRFEKGDDLTISLSPLENGDYIFFDTSGRGSYILSGYSQKRLLQAINALFFD